MNDQNSRDDCRSCGRPGLLPVLDLGQTPLANALLTAHEIAGNEEKFPLRLVRCPACTLVQITATVSPEKLFREYFYLSSFSDTMLQHARSLADELIETQRLGPESLVVEVASNDGYLLQYYKQSGIPVLGIEPAENIARVAREERSIPTISEFFNSELAQELAANGQRADVFHAHNVLAHVPDLNGLVSGLRQILKEHGVAVLEVPYLKDMIDNTEFDTIYHEHLCYFSLTALDHLFARHSLVIEDVKRLSLHGGTLRVYVRRDDGPSAESSEQGTAHRRSIAVDELLKEETTWVGNSDFYRDFGQKVERLRAELVTLLKRLKSENQRIAVYGASAKGSTLMNYFGLGKEILDFVVDRSTVKQGYYTPGNHLPILATEKLLEAVPDYVLLLTWNFADEILAQQNAYRKMGGRFIIPIPELRIV
jgi:SAM-dependent methyltransferase